MLRKDWRKKSNFNWTEELQNGSVIERRNLCYTYIRKTRLI